MTTSKKKIVPLFAIAFAAIVLAGCGGGNDVPIKMVFVEGGTFEMGCGTLRVEVMDCADDERPAHSVTVGDFHIGKYEVTQKQWKRVMGKDNNPSRFRGDNLPVENVSWNDVEEFIRKLNEMTGKDYRLPTEAEWEYAAIGGNTGNRYGYNGDLDEEWPWYQNRFAWYELTSKGRTHPVGKKLPNGLGLHDMIGNVWEWVNDWYGYYTPRARTNPAGPASGTERVLRGNSYDTDMFRISATQRPGVEPDYRSGAAGFRLASGTPPPAAESAEDSAAAPLAADIPIDMVFVRGGTFTMGCTEEQGDDCLYNEKPARSVTVGDFYIGKYEVTQRLWGQVMGHDYDPSYFKDDDFPVDKVSWTRAQQFLVELNRQTGKKYRLPTEAEWEYAARGGSKSKGYKYSGGDNIEDVAWYCFNSGDTADRCGHEYNSTHPVGTKSPNELGIYDMSGNVQEWVSDWYNADYYGSGPDTDPQGPPSGINTVYRGGSWFSGEGGCRVSARDGNFRNHRMYDTGMRLALSP